MESVKGNKQLGLSLIELLIGLFLISLISAMLIQAYTINKYQYLSVQKKLEHHFDAQWISNLLGDSVRRAGFTPCLNIEQLEVMDRRKSPKFIEGGAIQIQQDGFRVNRMSEHFAEMITIVHPQKILVSQEMNVHKQYTLLIADCEHAEIHRLIQIEKTAQGFLLTLDAPLLFSYSSLTYVGQWLEEFWFIKRNKEGVPALYYKQSHSEELSSFIHSLSIKKRLLSGKQILDISLGLDNQHTQRLTVSIRT